MTKLDFDWPVRMVLIGVFLTVAAACGDDDGDEGIDPGTPVSDLTPDEAAALCDELGRAAERRVGDLDAIGCTIEALLETVFTGGSVEDCEATAAECVAGGGPGEPTLDCDIADPADRAECDATVAEIRTCNDAFLDVAEPFVEALSCELVDDPTGFPEPPENPPACTALAERCPIYAEEDEE